MESSRGAVVEAINVLFSASVPSRELLAGANQYLLELAAQKDCFNIAITLIHDDNQSPLVRSFCANMLYNKVYYLSTMI